MQTKDAWDFLKEEVLDLRDLFEYITNYPDDPDDPDWDEEEAELLNKIKSDLSDHGIDAMYAENEPTAIAERYFEEYAEELANDIGAIDKDASWPINRIDWKAAADDLKEDYTEFELEGNTFYVRAY